MYALNTAEIAVLRRIHELLGCAVLDRVLGALTHLGDGGAFWIALCVLMLIFRRTRRAGLCMACAMLMCLLCGNLILKPLIARPRPFVFDNTITLIISPPGEFSFPSGHSMNGFAAALSLRLYHRRAENAALILAGIIAFSRLYLMVHYPTDVLCGAAVGCIAALLSHKLLSYISGRKGRCG